MTFLQRAVLVGGQTIHAHDPSLCIGRPCCVHNPSQHAMSAFRQHWRSDTGIMERICPHGIGHPDPDDLSAAADGYVHGCDGCCRSNSIKTLSSESDTQ